MSTNVKLCNSFLSLNVILFKMNYVLHSFESLCKAMCADHLLGRCLYNQAYKEFVFILS